MATCMLHVTAVHASVIPVDELSPQNIKLIENKGQWDNRILFKAGIPGGTLFITQTGITYELRDEQALFKALHDHQNGTVIKSHVIKMNLGGARLLNQPFKSGPSKEYYNYFIGNDAGKWKSECRAWGKIVFSEVWDGIDLEIISLKKRIKLNFVVHPFANPAQIKLLYQGQDQLDLRNDGLWITTTVGNIHELNPVSFQPALNEDKPIETVYRKSGDTISLTTTYYNPSHELVIDPEVIFGTFSGAYADNWGYTATNDTAGNGYSGGTVHDNSGFPTTPGAFQTTWAGGYTTASPYARDCGILKYSSDGTSLLFCTYIGGSSNEGPHSMICDEAGNLYIMGATWSANFPVKNGYDNSYNGKADIYVCSFSPDGKTLIASTFIGGKENDGFNGKNDALPSREFYDTLSNTPLAYNYGDYFRGEIMLDGSRNVYIATSTFSSDSDNFPLRNAAQNTFGGKEDGVVIKLNNGLNNIIFSTYLGGSGYDAAYAINIDRYNNIYVTGGTYSSNFGPVTGVFKHHGYIDAFVAKFSTFGGLSKVICYGTEKYDQSYLIQFDSHDNVYIAGQTEGEIPSKNSPVSVDFARQFITCFNHDLDSVIRSVNFGKTGTTFPDLSPSALLVDICDRVYFSGWGGAVNWGAFNQNLGFTNGLYTTNDAIMKSTDGSDFYLIVFAPDLTKIDYATFIGGTSSQDHVDGGTSRFDKNGIIYQSACAGCRGTNDFYTTPLAYSRINNSSNCNNALLKMDLFVNGKPPVIKDTSLTVKSIADTILYTYPNDTFRFTFDVRDYTGLDINTTTSGSIYSQVPNAALVTKTIVNTSWHRFRITWPVLCSNANDTVYLDVNSINNNCPNPLSNIARIRIFVKPLPVPNPPFPECVQHINDSTLGLKWRNDHIPAKNISSYTIHRRIGNGFFAPLTTLPFTNNSFIDTAAFDHLSNNFCYFFTSEDVCVGTSLPSRMICSMYKEDTATTKGFNYHPDTILYMSAFDTVSFADTIFALDPNDSVYLRQSTSSASSGQFLAQQIEPMMGMATYSFKFSALCKDITKTDTFTIFYFANDNQCPTPRTILNKLKIVVFAPPLMNPPSLKCIRKINADEVMVRWANLPVNKYFSHYMLLRKMPNGSISKVAEIYGDTTISKNLNASGHENINYCYALCPVSVCGTPGDTSPFQCTVHTDAEFPASIYPYTVTVVDNQHVRIFWKKSEDPTYLAYNVYRKTLIGSDEIEVLSNTRDTTFLDKNVKVNDYSYCYIIRQTNDCGLETKEDKNVACSILLNGTTSPFKHDIDWNRYTYWPAGTMSQTIFRMQPNQAVEVLDVITPDTGNYIDVNLDLNNGQYFYLVEAHEAGGGYGFSSLSNQIELIQKPMVYAPNVFTPDGNGINDTWEPHPVFVKTYDLNIYNRWGQLVFHTNNKHETFSGNFNSNDGALDVYVYQITYTGWDNSTHLVKGNFTVLR